MAHRVLRGLSGRVAASPVVRQAVRRDFVKVPPQRAASSLLLDFVVCPLTKVKKANYGRTLYYARPFSLRSSHAEKIIHRRRYRKKTTASSLQKSRWHHLF